MSNSNDNSVVENTLIKRNIIANYAGSIWTALMSLAFVPLYIHFMGMEAYGLVGFFAILLSIFALLDMGLSSTLNREMARLSALTGNEKEMHNLVHTLGLIYWVMGGLIVIVVIALSAYISESWVKAENLPPATVKQAVMLMGIAIGLQWPTSFYSGGLMGLQRQVLLNVVIVAMATLRGIGSIFILWLVSPTILAFFSWQVFISGMQTACMLISLWSSMPPSKEKTGFQFSSLLGIWRFAAGMFGISMLATLLTQTDKIILSRMLTLEMFGYYSLAGLVSMSLYRFIMPLFTAVYPRLTQLVAVNDQVALKELYHRSCQMLSLVILPVAMVLVFFSKEILFLWTQNSVTANNTYQVMSLLVAGTALNSLMNLPYALQLAHGWTKLAFYVNMVSVILLVPMIFFMAKWYGAVGAAIVWVILNSGYILICIPLMHRRLLPDEKWRWYWQDTGIPLVASISIAGVGRLLMFDQLSQPFLLLFIIFITISTIFVTAIVIPTTRLYLFRSLRMVKLFENA